MSRFRSAFLLVAIVPCLLALVGCIERGGPTEIPHAVADKISRLTCDPTTQGCTLRDLSSGERATLEQAIDEINDTAHSVCAQIKNAAYGHAYRAYDQDVGEWGDHHSSADSHYPEEAHFSGTNFTSGETKNTVIHEIAHHLGYNEQDSNYFMELCQ